MSGSIVNLLSIFTANILPIFLVASAGFLLAASGRVSVKTLARVVFDVLTPCLAFNVLVTSPIPALEFGRMMLFCTLVTVAMGLCGRVAASAFSLDRPTAVAFMLVVMLSNAGNYGLPLTLFAFGAEALTFATVYFVTRALLTYTVGVVVAASGRRTVMQALAGLLRIPMLYSVGAAAIVLGVGEELPVGVMRPIALLSDATLPMMMLVLGMQLQRAKLPERPALVATAVGLSLLVKPAIGLLLAQPLGLAGPAFQAAVIQAAMPAAVVTTILALEFDVEPTFVTTVVFLSTALSPLTLNVLIASLQAG